MNRNLPYFIILGGAIIFLFIRVEYFLAKNELLIGQLDEFIAKEYAQNDDLKNLIQRFTFSLRLESGGFETILFSTLITVAILILATYIFLRYKEKKKITS